MALVVRLFQTLCSLYTRTSVRVRYYYQFPRAGAIVSTIKSLNYKANFNKKTPKNNLNFNLYRFLYQEYCTKSKISSIGIIYQKTIVLKLVFYSRLFFYKHGMTSAFLWKICSIFCKKTRNFMILYSLY